MKLHTVWHLYERGVGEVPEPDACTTAHIEDLAKAMCLKVRVEQVAVAGPLVGIVLIIEPLRFAKEGRKMGLSGAEWLSEEVVLSRGGGGTEARLSYPVC